MFTQDDASCAPKSRGVTDLQKATAVEESETVAPRLRISSLSTEGKKDEGEGEFAFEKGQELRGRKSAHIST
jgi:hypothetical protein